VAELEKYVDSSRTYQFDDPQTRWWEAQLSQLVTDLRAFSDEQSGLFSAGTSAQGWGIVRRRQEASTIEERSVSSVAAKRLWDEAIASIKRSPKYGGLELTPQLGLVPLGEDPDSRLWEFAHVQSGDIPKRGENGELNRGESMSIVFVLIPKARFWMGAQKMVPDDPNFDPQANVDESLHEVELNAYFVSKYEMTQGQWEWLTGRNPSQYGPGWKFGDKTSTLLNPVENVSWTDCTGMMTRMGLLLPTEAQWEYAARSSGDSPWWTGNTVESVEGAGNLADRFAQSNGGSGDWKYEAWLDDGFTTHASVGSFKPNMFGLYDVIGNVWEWCRDGYGRYKLTVLDDVGERQVAGVPNRVIRGGSFNGNAFNARSAMRGQATSDDRSGAVGLRPARAIQRLDAPALPAVK
jgi:formylglycine-generating enzyme required for sulfatase activity